MSTPTEPTEEGKRRYPPDGYYKDGTGLPPIPCTCTPACERPCFYTDGCKCLACAEASLDRELDV